MKRGPTQKGWWLVGINYDGKAAHTMRRPLRRGAAALLILGLATRPRRSAAPHGDTDTSCAVSCVGKAFSGAGRSGEPVCGYEACGNATPFVGLDTFGCSGNARAFGGNCCNTATCAGWLPGHDRATGASICRSESACEAVDLARRADEVAAVCCDEGLDEAGCDASGVPSKCSIACADVVLAFIDDCAIEPCAPMRRRRSRPSWRCVSRRAAARKKRASTSR